MRKKSDRARLIALTVSAILTAPSAAPSEQLPRASRLGPSAPASSTTASAAPAPDMPPAIKDMIDRGRHAFANGKPAEAAELFESAVEHGEFTEAEVGEVRSRLWAGQFRHAVTISNVVAGEHPESAQAQALLGYIEDRVGYTGPALQRLRREQTIHPKDFAPVAAEAEVLTDRHAPGDAIALLDRWAAAHGADAELCRLRTRAVLVQGATATMNRASAARAVGGSAAPDAGGGMGPAATSDAAQRRSCGSSASSKRAWEAPPAPEFPSALGRPVAAGNGLIVDDGRRVVTLRRLVDIRGAAVWVRTARGELRQARVDPTPPDEAQSSPTVDLLLSEVIPSEQGPDHAPPDAHGLCFALGFPAAISGDAMLPAVTPCYSFAPHVGSGELQLNIPLSDAEAGTPVFDAQGRLMGLADPPTAATVAETTRQAATAGGAANAGGRGGAAAQGKAGVRRLTPTGKGSGAAYSNQATIAMPELYERLAPTVAQIWVFAAP